MQEQNYSIKQWAKDDRPREKLLLLGAQHLTPSELLAILIQSGTRAKSALDLAQEVLLKAQQNLNEMGKLSPAELMKIKGIGKAKAVIIAAALELGRRRLSVDSLEKSVVTASHDVAEYLRMRLRDLQQEVFVVIFLNRANRIIAMRTISEGGITGTIADPRIILKQALEITAVSIILCHNHPSGSLRPSRADEELTTRIRQAAALLDIRVLDHIIVSEEGYYSFADEGMI